MTRVQKAIAGGIVAFALLAGTAWAVDVKSNASDRVVYAESQNAVIDLRKTIEVAGLGEMMVEPDIAYISMGIFADAPTAQEAQQKVAQSMAKLEKVLTSYKVDEKDIKTSGFHVEPRYHYGDKEPKLLGYQATHTLRVAYRDLDKLGKLLDEASRSGVNQMNGIEFGSEKLEEYELQVLEKAMDNAKLKANTIAKATGEEVEAVIQVNYGGMGRPMTPSPVYEYAKAASDMALENSTSVSAGQMKLTTTVTVKYQF